MGIRQSSIRNTLANANNKRDWDLCDFASTHSPGQEVISPRGFGVELEQTVYALDATPSIYVFSLFPWASFRQNKGAIKTAYPLGFTWKYPSFIEITVENSRSQHFGSLDPRSRFLLHHGPWYLDFLRLYTWHQASAFFVIRAKSISIPRLYSQPSSSHGVQCDQTIVLRIRNPPGSIRQTSTGAILRCQNDKRYTFLTNNFALDAFTITQLYKSRWKIELFFNDQTTPTNKGILWNLRKCYQTQIWIAISIYVLGAIIKKQLN